jgi:hypothetical protein
MDKNSEYPIMAKKKALLRHEGVWGSGRIDLHFLDLGTGWRRVVSASCPGRFAPGTHWIGGWLRPSTGLDDVEKRKISGPTGSRTPTPQSYIP